MTAVERPAIGPLVSVIVPVYNGARFVRETIESARLQTYRNLEIVVVDDGSADETPAVLARCAAEDPRVRVFRQTNAGVGKARNRAVEESRGELLAPLDADDLWVPHKIERQVQRMLEAGENTGFVYSWWVWLDESGGIVDRSPEWRVEGDALEPLVLINFCGNASVQLFRKRWLAEAGGYNPDPDAAEELGAGACEDLDLLLRVAERHPIALVPEVLVGYRRSRGTRSQNLETMWRSHLRLNDALRRRRPQLPPALLRQADRQFCMYLAGLAFVSGNTWQAFKWAARAGLRLPLRVLPYALRLLGRRSTADDVQTLRPGGAIDISRVPGPLLPYDRIYRF